MALEGHGTRGFDSFCRSCITRNRGFFGGVVCLFVYFLSAVAISLFVPAALCPAPVLAVGSCGQPGDPTTALSMGCRLSLTHHSTQLTKNGLFSLILKSYPILMFLLWFIFAFTRTQGLPFLSLFGSLGLKQHSTMRSLKKNLKKKKKERIKKRGGFCKSLGSVFFFLKIFSFLSRSLI